MKFKKKLLILCLLFIYMLYTVYTAVKTNGYTIEEFMTSYFFNIQKIGLNLTVFSAILEFNDWVPILTPIYQTRLKKKKFIFSLTEITTKSLLISFLYLLTYLFFILLVGLSHFSVLDLGMIVLIHFCCSFLFFTIVTYIYLLTNKHTLALIITSVFYFFTTAFILGIEYIAIINSIGQFHAIYLTVIQFVTLGILIHMNWLFKKKECLQ